MNQPSQNHIYLSLKQLLIMKNILLYFLLLILSISCEEKTKVSLKTPSNNPFFGELNEAVNFAKITPTHIIEAKDYALTKADQGVTAIKELKTPTYENLIVALDDLQNDLDKVSTLSYIIAQVHSDSTIRAVGIASSDEISPFYSNLYSDKAVYNQIIKLSKTDEYRQLTPVQKKSIDDLIIDFDQSGVSLSDERLDKMKQLNKEINELTSQFTNNLNSHSDVLRTNEDGMKGLSDTFKESNRVAQGQYEIQINHASCRTFLVNATSPELRKEVYFKYKNVAAKGNMPIIDQLRDKRYELAQVMGKESMADLILESRMAKDPETVWAFLNDLIDRSLEKGKIDYQELINTRNAYLGTNSDEDIVAWDYSFYFNELRKKKYQLDKEKIRAYLPMDQCLEGMMATYQTLLGLEFKEKSNEELWHSEARMFEVLKEGQLIGRFYLDLFPRPNKNTWAYCMPFNSGKNTENGYQIPSALLLTNFTPATESKPSLISHGELSTLFHEFGHVMDNIAYSGALGMQSGTKRDFVESMSQIFENWIWDYEILSSFAKHYETGEILPKSLFDKMIASKNLGSGLGTLSGVRNAYYDLMLYHKHDPNNPIDTDEIWKKWDEKQGFFPRYTKGTHSQASWIHINGFPVYTYGYLWSDVYSQDMFTQFEENGLLDTETGKRYSDLIMGNGSQRTIKEAVEDFLGRPSNNKAYIQSLGL